MCQILPNAVQRPKEREARSDEQLLQRGRVGWGGAASDGTVKVRREENEAERHGN